MNSFGLKRNGVNTFGLGIRIGAGIVQKWREIVNFALLITRQINKKVRI